jgi:hypothetical protein
MTKIQIDPRKLLGFKISQSPAAVGVKTGVKVGTKPNG